MFYAAKFVPVLMIMKKIKYYSIVHYSKVSLGLILV